jgi:hypothetical protein
MVSPKKKKKKADESRPGSLISAITRFVFTLVALAIILTVSAYLFVRTEGFRSLVSDRLEKATGVRLEADSSRIAWNGAIVFQDIHSADSEGDPVPGFTAASVQIQANLVAALRGQSVASLRAVHVQDWGMQFSMDDTGVWQPASLGQISDWLGRWGSLALPEDEPGVSQAAAAPDEAKGDQVPEVRPPVKLAELKETKLRIRNGEIIWRDRSGNPLAEIRGVTFNLTPLDLPTNPASHYHLQVESATATDGSKVRDMNVELLRTGLTYLVINLEAVRQTAGRAEEIPQPVSSRTESTSRAQEEPDPEREILEELIREELRDALANDE